MQVTWLLLAEDLKTTWVKNTVPLKILEKLLMKTNLNAQITINKL